MTCVRASNVVGMKTGEQLVGFLELTKNTDLNFDIPLQDALDGK